MYHGTASAFDKDFRKARSRAIAKLAPTRRSESRENVAAAIVSDIPELAGRGIVVRSPSTDGPLAIGVVA